MNKIKNIITVVLCMAMIVSCAKQEIEGGANGSGNVSVTLALDIPSSEIITRSATDDASRENGVSHLDVLFFDAAGENSADPLFTRRDRLVNVSTVETGKIRAVIKNMSQGMFYIMAVANAGDESIYADIDNTKTLSWVQANLKIDAGDDMPVSQFRMAGVSNAVENITTENQVLNPITLFRTVARIDVLCGLNGAEYNPFELVSAEIRNARTGSYIFGQKALNLKDEVVFPESSRIVDYERPLISGNMPAYAFNGKIEAQLYAFENSNDDPSVAEPKDKTTCLIVGGKFNGSETTTYYRIDIQNSNGKYVIKRNHRYIIKILSVLGPGYHTKQEAEDGTINNLKVEIESWIDGLSGIAIQGNYMMSVSQTRYQFEKISEGLINDFRVEIKNMDPAGFYIEQSAGSDDWLEKDESEEFVQSSDNVFGKKITFRIKKSNAGNNTRIGHFMLRHRDGSISLKVTVEQGTTSRINLRVVKQEITSASTVKHEVAFDFGNANHDNATTGLKWSVESLTPWITINTSNPSNGTGRGSFYIDAAQYTQTGFSRNGQVRMTITEAGGNQMYFTVTIRQLAEGVILDGIVLDPIQLSLKIPDEGFSSPYIIRVQAMTTYTLEREDGFPTEWKAQMVAVDGGYNIQITAEPVIARELADPFRDITYHIGYLHILNAKGSRIKTLMIYQGYVKTFPTNKFYDPSRNVEYNTVPESAETPSIGIFYYDISTPIFYDLVAHGQRVWFDRNINAKKGYNDLALADYVSRDAIGTVFYSPWSEHYNHSDPEVEEANRTVGPCPLGFRLPNFTDVSKMYPKPPFTWYRRYVSIDDTPRSILFNLTNYGSGLIYDKKQPAYMFYFDDSGSMVSVVSNNSGVARCVSIR